MTFLNQDVEYNVILPPHPYPTAMLFVLETIKGSNPTRYCVAFGSQLSQWVLRVLCAQHLTGLGPLTAPFHFQGQSPRFK